MKRTSYDGKNAPPGIRFKVFLIWFQIEEEDVSDWIRAKLTDGGFGVEDHDDLIRYFSDLTTEIEAESDRGTQRIICHSRAAELSDVEIRAAWNAIGDLRNGVYTKYLAIASGELAAMGYVDFPEKLESMENSFADTDLDYRDTINVNGKDLLASRSRLCASYENKYGPLE